MKKAIQIEYGPLFEYKCECAAKAGFEEISHIPHMPEFMGDVFLNFGTVRGVIEARRVNGEWTIEVDGKRVETK